VKHGGLDMEINIGIDTKNREQIAGALSRVGARAS
jgi:hypothetical protein